MKNGVKKFRPTTAESAEFLERIRRAAEEIVARCRIDPVYREQLLKRIGAPRLLNIKPTVKRRRRKECKERTDD